MSEHTPESWIDGTFEFLQRAGACMKACAGMDDPVAEIGAIKQRADAFRERGAIIAKRDFEIATLRETLAELVSSAESFKQSCEDRTPLDTRTHCALCDVIAKAREVLK